MEQEKNVVPQGNTPAEVEAPNTPQVVEKEVVAPSPSSLEEKPTPVGLMMQCKQWFQNHARIFYGVLLLILLVVLASIAYIYRPTEVPQAVKQFTNVYSFVPEKISKSAFIPITLPKGVNKTEAQSAITFSPELKGSWVTETDDGVVVFDPEDTLRSGVYYAVNMDTGSVQMSGDFYVDEDPQIQSIFPVAGSETNEDSEITIMFNRPMVPLTTLTTLESIALPITITPETKGRFKWISTRSLQFIPETTLVPSSNYTVVIGDGLISVDGLRVAPQTHSFVTRPLRYTYNSQDGVGYRSPIVIEFNQPVDLERTKSRVTVTRADGATLDTVITYGETSHYNWETGKTTVTENQSSLFIYQKEDTHGRERLWDFNTTYTVNIGGASPIAGNLDLDSQKTFSVSVPNIVESVIPESDRTHLVRTDFFDPEGTLKIRLYEDVDKERSRILGKGIHRIEYDEKCKVDGKGEEVMLGNTCEKEADKRTLIISFNKDAFGLDEQFTITLDRMVTPDGFRINAEPIEIALRTYPLFMVFRTLPDEGGVNAALNEITVCSNAPLKGPSEEEKLSSFIQTSGYIVFGRWSESIFVGFDYNSNYYKCKGGEFQTTIPYGLLPETDYRVELSLADVFGRKADKDIAFKTTTASEQYVHFYNMQDQYNVTKPERTKLTYAVENLEYVDMHICKMTPETFLKRTVEQYSYTEAPSDGECIQVVRNHIELPHRYWVNNYFQVDLHNYFADTRGHYVITFSHPLFVTENGWYEYGTRGWKTESVPAYDRTMLSVTNLAVGRKAVERNDYGWSESSNPQNDAVLNKKVAESSNLYWVNYSSSLTPVLGATVSQYTSGGESNSFLRGLLGVTDSSGIARVKTEERLAGAVVLSGTDSAVVTDWADKLSYVGPVQNASRTYIYTDRPIYRPGHTVYVRGIDRIGFDGTYEVWSKDEVPLTVYDSMGTVIYDTKLRVSKYGTFNTEFELPADAPLGTYNINAFNQSTWFSVEEYVPAAFKLEAKTDKEEYVNGDTMKLDVQADYYFGVPLSEGTVSYAVTAQDYYFDRYTDEYFNFGSDWYYCYSCGYGDDFLFRGEAFINAQGSAHIERTLKLSDYFSDDSVGSKLVTVSVTAKDINGRSISMQKSFIVHKGDFYIGAITDTYYTGVNSPINLRVKTVDTQGKPVLIRNMTQTISKVTWETFKRQEVDGGFYYRSEKRLTEVKKEDISTDKDGNWQGSFSLPDEGQYEVTVTKTDEKGNVIDTTTSVYIYGDEAVPVPPNNNYELDLEVERPNVSVGDTGSVLIKSPYDHAKVLITAERGTLYDYWIKDITGGLYLHEFPITSGYAPNVFISALVLSSDPEVKYGSTEFQVNKDEHVLDVEVTSDKAYYLPGETVTLTVQTKDNVGKPIPAEVSLAVADLSVLALKGNPKKNPLEFFYNGFPLSVSTASNIKNILHEIDIPLGTKGGGGAPEDLATKKRGLFKDTAFWNASVETDSSGHAQVTFTLPDNLTTWQIESVGITEDTKIGVDYDEFTTKKNLMAIPLKPRFVVPGDTFMLGAKVFNQTDSDAKVDVKLDSSTLTFTDGKEDTVSIKGGETKTVYFEVSAPLNKRRGEHTFTFTASFGNLVDAVEQSIAITPNTTYETVATANMTSSPESMEYLYIPKEVVSGDGGLTIHANATLAVFMTDALTYMATYPYGCSEQLASALSTIGILQKALTVPNVSGKFETIEYEGVTYTVADVVTEGLGKIYETQNGAGGFAYYKGLDPSVSLTMHVLIALTKLKEAGFEVREDVITRAIEYIQSDILVHRILYDNEMVILAEYALREANGNQSTKLTEDVANIIKDKAFLNEKISSMSLAYLAIMTADGWSNSDKKRVYDTLLNRIDIDGRGAYLKSNGAPYYSYFETPTKDTALLLKAFVARGDDHPQTGNVLRWLLASRDVNGVWGSTQNTFVVVDAMVDYLMWKHESEARFNLTAKLDGEDIFDHEFNATNVFSTFTHFISIDDIVREKLVPLQFTREDLNNRENNLYYDMSLKYFLPVESLPPRDEGITITRGLYALDDAKGTTPLTQAKVGDVVQGKLTIMTPGAYSHVAIEDMIPAGFEIVNQNLDTEQGAIESQGQPLGIRQTDNEEEGFITRAVDRVTSFFEGEQTAQVYDSWSIDGGYYGNETETYSRTLYPTHIESHDDRVFLYVESLAPGVYEYTYYLRALVPGTFKYLPARAEELYFPEVFGRTSGATFTVTEGE